MSRYSSFLEMVGLSTPSPPPHDLPPLPPTHFIILNSPPPLQPPPLFPACLYVISFSVFMDEGTCFLVQDISFQLQAAHSVGIRTANEGQKHGGFRILLCVNFQTCHLVSIMNRKNLCLDACNKFTIKTSIHYNLNAFLTSLHSRQPAAAPTKA